MTCVYAAYFENPPQFSQITCIFDIPKFCTIVLICVNKNGPQFILKKKAIKLIKILMDVVIWWKALENKSDVDSNILKINIIRPFSFLLPCHDREINHLIFVWLHDTLRSLPATSNQALPPLPTFAIMTSLNV